MATRVCAEPGCPQLVRAGDRGGRCVTHRRTVDRDRGSRAARGYGAEHQAQRDDWQQRMDSGETVECWRCGVGLNGRPWHLDHTDDRSGYRGPACAPCNLHLAGITRNRQTP